MLLTLIASGSLGQWPKEALTLGLYEVLICELKVVFEVCAR